MIGAEVAIIGAGPAGTAAAVHLGQLGVGNAVLVDRADFPRDKTCGSGVSPKGIEALRALGVWEQVKGSAYSITGLRLVTPGGRETYLSGGEAAAAVICRRRVLDELLLEPARALGVRFIPNFPVAALVQEGERVLGFTARDGRQVRARCTVVADGGHSRFAVDQHPRRLMQAIMGWWDRVPFRPCHVEIVFDRMLLPGYGWLFPESDTRVNIGICYEDPAGRLNARVLFRRFLDTHYAARLRGATAAGGFRGHPISYGFTVGRLWSPGRLVIGEAGRMVHPATAEGIYQGLRSGMLAAEALVQVLRAGVTPHRAFSQYERQCRRAFRFSFGAARLWRTAIASLSWTGWSLSSSGQRRGRRSPHSWRRCRGGPDPHLTAARPRVAGKRGLVSVNQAMVPERVVGDRVVLVGDATGCCHPLTATGFSVCTRDAVRLRDAIRARAGDLPEALRRYAASRADREHLLSTSRRFRIKGTPRQGQGPREGRS